MNFEISTAWGSALAPSFEHALVEDVMRSGVIGCDPDDSLRTVARIMSSYHVHSVVVALGGDVWGIISADDVLQSAGTERERLSAGEIAATDFVTVRSDSSLAAAAQLMRDHKVSHLIVTAPIGKPIGVISTLDIAGALAWGEA